jgi:acyl carrier protein
MKDLGADPVAAIELGFAFEEEFGIEIPDIDVQKIITVGDAVSYIMAAG